MAKNDNLTDFTTDIANAIREKTGKTNKINPQNFSREIKNIELGVFPEGDINITKNGNYNVKNYENAIVNVPGGGGSGETDNVEIYKYQDLTRVLSTGGVMVDDDTYTRAEEYLQGLYALIMGG